jgi:two-component system, chemotaxis family, chemotaxis protein CheY
MPIKGTMLTEQKSTETVRSSPPTGKLLLVADDAATIRLYYRQVLEAAGFSMDEAVNGVEAIERALRNPFDLLIADINMSPMDGLRLLRTVRQHPDLQSMPALVITTDGREETRLMAYEAGADFFLVKPVDPNALVSAVKLMTGVPS